MIGNLALKPVIWIGSTRRDFRAMPGTVKSDIGYALYLAQQGEKRRNAKPLKGFAGAGVVAIVSDDRGNTFRCVYTVRFAGSVYVLHVFQKKSKTGRETPKTDIALIAQRLRQVERIAKGEQA